MITRTTRSRRSAAKPAAPSPDLTWSHFGTPYRVTVWPDCAFECQREGRWRTAELTDAVIAAGAIAISAPAWRRFLDFVPVVEREFLQQFGFGRLAALQVIRESPSLLPVLIETPALTAFLIAHPDLRGTLGYQWTEVTAVHERSGVFGVLEWLGLPAARETLIALRNLVDADVPRRLLEPLRTSLWNPSTATLLCHQPAISDRQLAHFCHALAA